MSENKKSFFSSIPGLITGLAGLVTGIVGLFTVLIQLDVIGGDDDSGPTGAGGTTTVAPATGERFVRHWLHAPMVEYDGTKMSKSLGNLVFISELVKDWDPMAVRLAIVDHSYRTPWVWHDGLLPQAAERLDRWRAADAGGGAASLDDVRAALDDDLDLPRALRAIDDAAATGQGVRRAADLIGVALT